MLREGHWEVEGSVTSEEMRKAIAEHLGWKLYQFNFAMRSWVALREPGFDPGERDAVSEVFEVGWEACEYLPFSWGGVPNWPEDLNAMREALAQLPEELEEEFMHFLCSIHGANPSEPLFTCFDVLTCKPQVYAKAFLKAVGKWRRS